MERRKETIQRQGNHKPTVTTQVLPKVKQITQLKLLKNMREINTPEAAKKYRNIKGE